MGEGESGVEAGGVRTAAELIEGHQFVLSDVMVDVAGHDLFDELAEAFNKLDRLVGLGEGHILFVVLGDDCNKGLLSRGVVYPEFDHGSDDGVRGAGLVWATHF